MADKIKIGKMRIEPVFTVAAWEEIEERFGTLEASIDALKDKETWRQHTAEMTAILCNHGLRKLGKRPALTPENVMDMMLPMRARQIVDARNLCLAAIAEGSRTDAENEEDEEPVDVVLEELEKKTGAQSAKQGA